MNLKTYRIVFIGGSYGGLRSLKHFINLFQNSPSAQVEIEIYLIDPRAGFINILGIPKAIVDIEFAVKSYLNVENYNINFSSVQSTDQAFIEAMSKSMPKEILPPNLRVNFIHGKVISFKDEYSITFSVINSSEIQTLDFDYAVYSAGRRRTWPFDPQGINQNQYIDEMKSTKNKIERANIITVIGGGALGIEIAGEIKDTYPEKEVKLVHPHPFLPPELYASKNLKSGIKRQIEEVGVNLLLNTRIKEELENGNLKTTDNKIIQSELNFWCNFHKNNIEPLMPYFQDSIELSTGEAKTDETLLLQGYKNIFVIGDIVNLPIIKTAGGAYRHGETVAQSLYNLTITDSMEISKIDIVNWPKGMTIVVGHNRCCSQWNNDGDGKVVENDSVILEMYKDYCNSSAKTFLNIS
ncbi:hypothetical protein WICMUC_003433 [Wickerhamomyces mucosus]|uniref:FAD/NAD(P)-binding domain-containing protein n=1 Tax=Wickerhamomyces mucosus TaxID=1378264 RepID=A0A9P8TCL0_9ASCO|nr:hypothetical protein WICMUC_003433 [Wickerhamomyces mucosus]